MPEQRTRAKKGDTQNLKDQCSKGIILLKVRDTLREQFSEEKFQTVFLLPSPVFTLHYWENMCTHILSVQGFLQLQSALFLGPKYPRPFCSPGRCTWAHHALQPSYQKAVDLTNRTWETRGIADDSSRGKESIKFNFTIVIDLPYRALLTSETQTERKMPLHF